MDPHFCPDCYGPFRPPATICQRCGGTLSPDRVIRVPIAQMTQFIMDLERRACPKCTFMIPVKAVACSECRHRSRPDEKAPELPHEVRQWLIAPMFEDSEVCPSPSSPRRSG